MKRTATAQLIEVKLGESLEAFVEQLRKDERSWSYIARKLRERTDNSIEFNVETLRKWFVDQDELAPVS